MILTLFRLHRMLPTALRGMNLGRDQVLKDQLTMDQFPATCRCQHKKTR